jgi:hypothetical protein
MYICPLFYLHYLYISPLVFFIRLSYDLPVYFVFILDDCKQRFPRGIDYGQVVCTKAGRMNFKFICHGALPDWTPGAKYSIKVICLY